MDWRTVAHHALEFMVGAVVLFNVWVLTGFVFATFVISISTPGTEIMWHEGWQETTDQILAMKEWLRSHV